MKIEMVNRYYILIDTKCWYKHKSFKAWNNQVLGFFLSKFLVIFLMAKFTLV